MTKLPQLAGISGGRRLRDGPGFETLDPATEDRIADIPASTGEEIAHAVGSATLAQAEGWGQMRAHRRRAALLELADQVERKADELARLESLENGIPIAVTREVSVAGLCRNLRYYAEWIDKVDGVVVPVGSARATALATREPFGVVAALTAYNTPSLFLATKVAPALAVGNTVVIKPSPLASLSTIRFVEIALEAGLPEGAVNVVLGTGSEGAALVGSPGVAMVSFTGSREAGAAVAGIAARRVVPVALELGGKPPSIVFPDADLDRAVPSLLSGCMALCGQACIAASRLLVHRSVIESVVERLADLAPRAKIGSPLSPGSQVGPLISHGHRQRVEDAIARARSSGLRVIGGERPPGFERGYFLTPALVLDAPDQAEVVTDELFGPVMAIQAFDDEDEAIQRANATRFGLAASVWTNDFQRAHRVASRLQAGTVWVNTYGALPHTAPFGGFKESGYGREGGRWAMEEFTQVKHVYFQLG